MVISSICTKLNQLFFNYNAFVSVMQHLVSTGSMASTIVIIPKKYHGPLRSTKATPDACRTTEERANNALNTKRKATKSEQSQSERETRGIIMLQVTPEYAETSRSDSLMAEPLVHDLT